MLNDNPWDVPGADVIGADGAALALARLAAAREFNPPLAVGVFGAWGSGKSLFMRRVYTEIERLTRLEDRSFHHDIVQIRFNAWHYADADLWASLVGCVFEELDAYSRRSKDPDSGSTPSILGGLTTARELTLESARLLALRRRTAAQAQSVFRQAEAELEAKRRAFAQMLLPKLGAGLGALWRGANKAEKESAADQKKVMEAVSDAYGEPLEVIASRWSDATAAADALARDGSVLISIGRQFGRARTLVSIVVAALAGLGAPVLVGFLADGGQGALQVVKAVTPVVSAAATMLTAVAGFAVVFTRRAIVARDAIVETVRRYREAHVAAGQRREAADHADLERAERDLTLAEAQVERAQSSLAEALHDQASASQAFSQETAAGRLRAFVRQRAAADGPYLARQGLIGAIRRDFADLSALMAAGRDGEEARARKLADEMYSSQVANLIQRYGDDLTKLEQDRLRAPEQPSAEPVFTRIVLYIDDLDRCPPRTVIQVLEAVHLLLAFSLFIVIVAVDVRWLEGSLIDHNRIFTDASEGGHPETRAAGDRSDVAALDYLEKIFQVPIWTSEMTPGQASAFVKARLDVRADSALSAAVADREVVSANGAAEAPRLQPLRLSHSEVSWLEDLAPIAASTPRRLLRLINSYRLARASLAPSEATAFLAAGYRGFAVLLALAATAPLHFPDFLAAVGTSKNLDELATSWKATAGRDKVLGVRIEELVALMRKSEMTPAVDLEPHLSLAPRFSFSQL